MASGYGHLRALHISVLEVIEAPGAIKAAKVRGSRRIVPGVGCWSVSAYAVAVEHVARSQFGSSGIAQRVIRMASARRDPDLIAGGAGVARAIAVRYAAMD
jgi:hypothetical protein